MPAGRPKGISPQPKKNLTIRIDANVYDAAHKGKGLIKISDICEKALADAILNRMSTIQSELAEVQRILKGEASKQ